MEIIAIAAIGKNNVLGKDNKMLWHLPEDFKFFKNETSHHFIVMGRKTFEAFPKPLPNRTHIVITRNTHYNPGENIIVKHQIEDAINVAKENNQEKLFIIGGAEIYHLAMPYVTKMLITHVNFESNGDAYFPKIELDKWHISEIQQQPMDDKHAYSFVIKKYERK